MWSNGLASSVSQSVTFGGVYFSFDFFAFLERIHSRAAESAPSWQVSELAAWETTNTLQAYYYVHKHKQTSNTNQSTQIYFELSLLVLQKKKCRFFCDCFRGAVKNYLADFFPLRGGYPPLSAKLFWAQ